MKKLAQEALLKAKEDIKNILKDQPFKIQLGLIRFFFDINFHLGGLEAFMDKKNSKNSLVFKIRSIIIINS